MNFLELAKNRYSERFFDQRPVEQEKLDKILEVGRVVPTACNYQPQRFYVLRSPEALAKARMVTPFHYNAPHDRMFYNYNSGEQDASIAAATMMYEAEELGVHSVWLRGFDAQTVSEVFELPENIIPVMMFAMGYPSEKAKPNAWHFKRMPLEAFVTEL